MKLILGILIPFLSIFANVENDSGVYQYDVETIEGEPATLEVFTGDVLLIVNTASECGQTPQYKDLQALYETYKDLGLTVLGFPANNFGGQEPGSDEEILEFCETNYNITFPLFSKISVKGDDIHPLFTYLTSAENPDFTGEIGWNFEKFLVDRNGKLIRRFKTNEKPTEKTFIEAIEEAL